MEEPVQGLRPRKCGQRSTLLASGLHVLSRLKCHTSGTMGSGRKELLLSADSWGLNDLCRSDCYSGQQTPPSPRYGHGHRLLAPLPATRWSSGRHAWPACSSGTSPHPTLTASWITISGDCVLKHLGLNTTALAEETNSHKPVSQP